MKECFINFSNHPSSRWGDKQRNVAEAYGPICDLPFPPIGSLLSEDEVLDQVRNYRDQIIQMHPAAVMCQGEFTFTFALVQELLKAGITCVSACIERNVEEHIEKNGTTKKKVTFQFVKFREYRLL